MDNFQGGVYTCLADNGFSSEPVTKAVKLEVHCEYKTSFHVFVLSFESCLGWRLIIHLFPDAPHISVEHPRLETGYGETKELVCMVHAHPKAKVRQLNQMINWLSLRDSWGTK